MTQIEDTSPAPSPSSLASPVWLGRRLSLIGLGALVLLLVVLVGAGYAGYQAGMAQRDSQARATQAADLERQYELGQSDLAAGRYEVAQARFEYILQLDPRFRDAGQKLAQVRAAMAATPTPAPASATPRPEPSATQSHAAADLFAQAQTQYAAGDWEGVIASLSRLHAVDPNYQPVKVNGMLYLAYRNRGVALIAGNDMETGMFDLDKAEAIGPLDTEALNYRAWGRLYLAAQSFWGLNWQQAMEILQQLHLIAPYFHDTTALLYQSTVNYADQLAQSGDPCGAARHYTEAQALEPDAKVAQALAAAQASCAQTPTATASGTPGTPGAVVVKLTPTP
jgi:tetratricopeptide (TPR) repeat protein